MTKEKKKIENIKPLEAEYMEHLETDTDELYWTKECLKNEFTPVQRKIFVTYLELGTYKATAELFNVSQPTVQKYIKNLVETIQEYVCNHM
jgi:DNA invertase Pin-like site-specific DNA recombinase